MKAIIELEAICDVEGDSKKVGWRKRRDLLDKWLKTYTDEVEVELNVVNPDLFSSDYMDSIKEHLAKEIAEELTTSTKYTIDGTKIKAKIKCIRFGND